MLLATKALVKIVSGLAFITAFLSTAYANDAVILLNQMNDALHKLEYQGKLVYIKDGEASNLSVRHTIENGAEKEIIVPLDENGDEYVKESNHFSLTALPKITPKMQQVYSFDLGGMAKVAGRPCRIVLARPKDRKRYLQKYCIDLDRSVLLKYSLINQYHKPVERFMFTDFEVISTPEVTEEPRVEPDSGDIIGSLDATEVGGSVASRKMTNSLAPAAGGVSNMLAPDNGFVALPEANEEASSVVNEMMQESVPEVSAPDNYSEWFFDPLPAGFGIISSGKMKDHDSEEQVVISDGLSSVSVFISESNDSDKQFRPIRSGALNILSRSSNGYDITLVGEVPKSTLEDIYHGLKRATIKE